MKKIIGALALMSLAQVANAEFVLGVQAGKYTEPDAEYDPDITVLAATLGYQFNLIGGFSLTPEVRFGAGVSDSKFDTDLYLTDGYYFEGTATAEITEWKSASLRAQYLFENGLYLYTGLVYSDVEYKVTLEGQAVDYWGDEVMAINQSETAADGQLGGIAGLGYQFNDVIGLELGYEIHFDDNDSDGYDEDYEVEAEAVVYTLGLRFHF